MKKARQTKKAKSCFGYYLLAALLLFASAALGSFYYLKPRVVFKSPFIENIESRISGAKSHETEIDPIRLYESTTEGLSGNNNKPGREALLVIAEDIIKKYIEPYEAKLLDLYMDKRGIIYADFSSELKNNFHGDALDEYRIIANLYKKIRVNIPGFNALKILIDGKESDSIGGHIDISKPVGRKIENVIKRKSNRYF